jgi:hypothetical protein
MAGGRAPSSACFGTTTGGAFFGAKAAKVLIVRMKRYPVWVIPTAGGLLFTTLIVVWYTSATLVLLARRRGRLAAGHVRPATSGAAGADAATTRV